MEQSIKLLFLIFTLFVFSCQEPTKEAKKPNESELSQIQVFNPAVNDDNKVLGNVESVTWYEHKGKIENEKVTKDFSYGRYVMKYDESGNLIEHSSYGRDKSKPWRIGTYKYHDGYLTERVEKAFDKEGNLEHEYIYEKYVYEDDKVKAYRYSEEEEVIFYYEIEFDENNRKVSELRDNKFTQHEDKQKLRYFYDEKGFIAKKTEVWSDEHFEQNYEVVYSTDSNGNITEKTRYNLETPNDKSGDRAEFKYDSKENWIRRVSYDKKDGMIFIHEREINYR